MNTLSRKTLSLPGRPAKVVFKPALAGVSSESYRMDDWAMENRGAEGRGTDNRSNRYHARQQDEANNNKIRRGPGRRLAKEKRVRGIDPALMQKYATLSPALQEKINAAIEIYYQQHMAKVYKGQVEEVEAEADDYFQEDVVYEADEVL